MEIEQILQLWHDSALRKANQRKFQFDVVKKQILQKHTAAIWVQIWEWDQISSKTGGFCDL